MSQAAPARLVLHSLSDEPLPLRLFWSPLPPRLAGAHHAHLRQPWLGAAAETGHAVLLSLEALTLTLTLTLTLMLTLNLTLTLTSSAQVPKS